MPYDMHRIFCATPGDLEDERRAFYELIAEFNEQHSVQRNVLFVPVSVTPNMTDTRSFRPAIKDNIRACTFYIQLLEDSWGPPQKNFEREFALAQNFSADPDLPMKEIVTLFKKPLLPHRVDADVIALKQSLHNPP